MNNLLNVLEQYSIKQDHKIKKICEPLHHLGIPYLWYYFIEADGTFGALSNDVAYTEYYISNNMHLDVPYYSHPSYFKSGHVLTPCAFKIKQQKTVKNTYYMSNMFLILKAYETRMEGFCFYDRDLNHGSFFYHYLPNIDLLEKFICYFKRETELSVKKQINFNIQEDRKENFFSIDESLPLLKNNVKNKKFLREIYNLSPQEDRCLELYKKGYTAQASASILNISSRTVETHINNIKRKWNCHSKLELLCY